MITYRKSGVSVDAGNELVRRIKKMVSSKKGPSPIGGFSGLFPVPSNLGKDLLLSGCCDGVGTKLKIAFLLNKHDTVGIDLVAMNVNDLICTGAQPLFFLDYFACGKLNVDLAEKVIRGIHKGCEESGCILLGGETAEMPGFYEKGEYDLAGFALGIVSREKAIDGKNVKEGDVLMGIPSSGIHSNGYSLVRKVFSKSEIIKLGRALIAPTRIYVKPVLSLLDKPGHGIKGIAHITGGGWYENIPRVLPKGFGVAVKKNSWNVLDIFKVIQKKAKISDYEMCRTFNMGIGLVIVAGPGTVSRISKVFKDAVVLGEVTRKKSGVVFE